MATVSILPRDIYSGGYMPSAVTLSTAQATSAASTNVVDRGGSIYSPALIKIAATVEGETPTCTYLIEGSANGTDWVPAAYADSATPTTVSVATFDITTTVTVYKIVQINQPWRYLRVTYSANTGVTNTATVTVF